MKKLIFLFLLTSFAYTLSAQTDQRLQGIDEEMEAILSTFQGAGFSVAVVEKDQVIFAKGYGYRDYEKKLPATENTIYAIGSCSKAFTSALVGKLEAEKKLKLTDHPAKHIPGLNFYDEKLNSQLQIKDLMCHRTGLPRHDYAWYLFPTHNKDSLVQKLPYLEPFAGIRERWYYNNFMFLLQGMITEKLTGKSWEDNLETTFFKPLGMEHTSSLLADWESSKEPAIGYDLTKDKKIKKLPYYDIAAMGPAGSINSSVKEMANWVITWINGGTFQGEEILPAAYVQQAMSSQMVIRGALPSKEHPDLHFANYGYGWFISSYKGHYMVQHGGNIDGFSASTCFFPSDSVGVIVLANQDGSPIPTVVRNTIADRLLGLEQSNWREEIRGLMAKNEAAQEKADSTKVANRKQGTQPSHMLVEFTGSYAHPGYGSFPIVLSNDSLYAIFKEVTYWLRPYHYDIFDMVVVEDGGPDTTQVFQTQAQFFTGLSGDIESVKIQFEPTVDPIEFERTPAAVEMDAEALQAYVGEYVLGNMNAKVYTKDAAVLYLFVPGQPEYELIPTGEHQFAVKNLQGFSLEFVAGDDAMIKGVLFKQPNGTFKAAKK